MHSELVEQARALVLHALEEVLREPILQPYTGLCARLYGFYAGKGEIRDGLWVVHDPLELPHEVGYAYYSGNPSYPVASPLAYEEAQDYYARGARKRGLYEGEQLKRRTALRDWLVEFYTNDERASDMLRGFLLRGGIGL